MDNVIHIYRVGRNLNASTSRAYNAMVYNSIYDGSGPIYETIKQMPQTSITKLDALQLGNKTTCYNDQPVHSSQPQCKSYIHN